MEHIYQSLMTFVLPWALEKSNLDEDEIQDYIHDFYLDLMKNDKSSFEVLSDNSIKKGRYDLELLRDPTKLSRFFFQFVQRTKYIEGQWIDRRIAGRRTQQEHILDRDLTPLHLPKPTSYEMYSKRDHDLFIQSLSEDESIVLNWLIRGEVISNVVGTDKHMSKNRYYKIVNTLQIKAKDYLM